jgi:hypothetical protein
VHAGGTPRRKRSMKLLTHTGAVLAAAAAIALGVPAAPALATGFGLELVAQSEAVVGKPMTVQAIGTIPPQDLVYPYFFTMHAIPATSVDTCPFDEFQGALFAISSGGGTLVLRAGEHPDMAGNFSIPITVTPTAPGSTLLCGYTDDGGAVTEAAASLILDINPAPPAPHSGSGPSTPPSASNPPAPSSPISAPTPPAQLSPRSGSSPPAYVRQGIKSCRALLAGAELRGCIHDVVRHANAGCRRLRPHTAKTRCLRAVRRAARQST